MKKVISIWLVLFALPMLFSSCLNKDHRTVTLNFYEEHKTTLHSVKEELSQKDSVLIRNNELEEPDFCDEYAFDDETLSQIKSLLENGCYGISKSDNYVAFVISTRFMDFGAGIVYSIEHDAKPELPYLTKLEPLEDAGWYYYEEDFNAWRMGEGI